MKTIQAFFAGLGVVGVLLFALFLFCINGLALHYYITFWATYVKHAPVQVSWLLCILVGLFTGPLPVTIALLTWILSFIL